ncbi:DUF4914 family protein [Salinispira pacifica]
MKNLAAGNILLERFALPPQLKQILEHAEITIPESREHLLDLVCFDRESGSCEVAYDVAGRGRVVEATVARCKNGIAVNYTETYMRRRDPDAMVIADSGPTDKTRFSDRFKNDFEQVRQDTFRWLSEQPLIVMPFLSGDKHRGYPTMIVAPANAGFFVAGLADLQGFIPREEIPDGFAPRAVIYVAPPFRHTHFDGKQVVIHNRLPGMHELFSYNLYPGPSAKKGVYGILLTLGEEEGWVTLHSSAVKLITPYDNEFVILHEGASGGGKSEMTQPIHREQDGRILLGENIVTSERFYLEMKDTCELHPVTDDMALAPPSLQRNGKKLTVEDAEAGWFLRVDHLTDYGTEPLLEKLTITPPEPLIFLNLEGVPGSTILIWEHTEDAPGKPCPNPRVIMPRHFVPNIIDGPIEVDVRSFGVRTPPCTRENPDYGIIGMLHILPPAIAWLWRLAAPRGHSNPSIVTHEGLATEGVGTYWPFATGKMVRQANLLLEQIVTTPSTKFVLIPNQHIGAFKVGFKPEWIAREYMARRGSVRFRPGHLLESRLPLLGYALPSLKVDGQAIPKGMLRVNEQLEVGNEGYDAGARILLDFFQSEVKRYYTDELNPLGRRIIDLCMNNASIEEYESVMIG